MIPILYELVQNRKV